MPTDNISLGKLIYELRSMSVGFKQAEFLNFAYVTDQAANRIKTVNELLNYVQHTKSCVIVGGKCECGLNNVLEKLK